jgi:GWxTD domain-containing protein
MRRNSIALCWIAVAAVSFAQMSKYKDWPKSPEAYFLTQEEKTEWTTLHTDDEAEKFIASYWAKRGGQRFKDDVARRISAADEQFKSSRGRGSLTVRGHVLIVLGGPSRVTTERAQIAGETAPGTASAPGAAFEQEPFIQTWTYDKSKFDPSWGIGEVRARILVEPQRGTDSLQGGSPVEKAMTTVSEKSIAHPTGMAPAVPAAAAGAPPPASSSASAPPASAAAPAAVIVLPAAVRSALETTAKENSTAPGTFWGGSFHNSAGEPLYSFELSVPGDRVPGGGVKFGGLVVGESGQEVASYWEDAKLTDLKAGTRTDKVFERSVALPPGSYRASFGLFPSEGASAIASASVAFKLDAKSNDFAVSPLILSNTVTPLTKRPGANDPFVFGTEKPVHVAPKDTHLFGKDESLWYFFTVTNPQLGAPAAAAPPAGTPPASTTPGTAAVPAAGEGKPRVMTRIGVLRNGQPAFAPFTGPAELQLLSPGYYAAGSEIPLSSFQPGYYTFTLNVRDLNAPRDSTAFKGVDLKEDFIVLNQDGTVPEKPAAAAPTPKPKPPAKKG